MHSLIFIQLWKANISVKTQSGCHDVILFALLVLITSQTLNLVLIAGLAYAQGITTGSLSLAYAHLMLEKAQDASQIAKNSQFAITG